MNLMCISCAQVFRTVKGSVEVGLQGCVSEYVCERERDRDREQNSWSVYEREGERKSWTINNRDRELGHIPEGEAEREKQS